MNENLYGKNAAKYYYLVAYYDYDKVAKSFASCIKGKNVLELGIGTGLTGLRLAKLGFKVDGIDNSNPMLNVTRRKLMKESKATRARLRLYHQSASNIKLKGPYDAVISQGGVLTLVGPGLESYLKTEAATYNLLKRIFEILTKGGSLIINLQPARQKVTKRALAERYFYTGRIKKSGNMLIVTHVIEKNCKILVKQTFEKLYLSRQKFEKMASDIGFKIIGRNKTGLHYILEK